LKLGRQDKYVGLYKAQIVTIEDIKITASVTM
jgi:hypothetical protein